MRVLLSLCSDSPRFGIHKLACVATSIHWQLLPIYYTAKALATQGSEKHSTHELCGSIGLETVASWVMTGTVRSGSGAGSSSGRPVKKLMGLPVTSAIFFKVFGYGEPLPLSQLKTALLDNPSLCSISSCERPENLGIPSYHNRPGSREVHLWGPNLFGTGQGHGSHRRWRFWPIEFSQGGKAPRGCHT